MTKPVKYKTADQTIQERETAEREELIRLRNLKRNLESGIVFEVSDDLMEILLSYETKDL